MFANSMCMFENRLALFGNRRCLFEYKLGRFVECNLAKLLHVWLYRKDGRLLIIFLLVPFVLPTEASIRVKLRDRHLDVRVICDSATAGDRHRQLFDRIRQLLPGLPLPRHGNNWRPHTMLSTIAATCFYVIMSLAPKRIHKHNGCSVK